MQSPSSVMGGKLYAVKTYVKASGGCSAPAIKADKAGIGEMRFRQLGQTPEAASNTRTAQIMIRHPNNSGLQMHQVTRLNIPPFFLHSLKVWQEDELLLAMEGSISISEDPNIRFTYVPDNSSSLRGLKWSIRPATGSAAVGRQQAWNQ